MDGTLLAVSLAAGQTLSADVAMCSGPRFIVLSSNNQNRKTWRNFPNAWRVPLPGKGLRFAREVSVPFDLLGVYKSDGLVESRSVGNLGVRMHEDTVDCCRS